jgi:hypothetical protein
MRDINAKIAADRQGTSRFKLLFLRLMILSVVFPTNLKLMTSNTQCPHKNECIYPLRKFRENPHTLRSLY